MRRYLAVPLLFLLLAGECFAAEITVGNFASGDMTGWKPKIFKGETLYSFVRDGKRTVLKAYSKNAASGLFKKVKVDSAEYPVLRWSWKIDRLLEREDAASKQGDDFAARVYVVFPGTLFWRTRATSWTRARRQHVAGSTWTPRHWRASRGRRRGNSTKSDWSKPSSHRRGRSSAMGVGPAVRKAPCASAATSMRWLFSIMLPAWLCARQGVYGV